jgi:hypothetical protein
VSTFFLVACVAGTGDAGDFDGFDEDGEDLGTSASALTCSQYDATRGAAVARAAAARQGHRSQHRCFHYVKAHLARGGVHLPADVASGRYGGHAYQFATWAKNNPNELAAAGLARVPNPDLDALPKGAIVVWPRGDCGYSKTSGHIEIVIDEHSSRACSDFCGNLHKNCRTPPDVFIPVTSGSGGSGAGCGGSTEDAGSGDARAPQEDSCEGRSAGWYCSQLRNFGAFKCDASGSIVLGYQCPSNQSCSGGAGNRATVGADGNPQCGGGQ